MDMNDKVNFKNLSNDKLIEMMGTLSKNHEKIKFEILILNEIITNIQNEYVEISNELKSRV